MKERKKKKKTKTRKGCGMQFNWGLKGIATFMQKLLGGPLQWAGLGQDAYRPLWLPDHLLACLPRTLGTAQGETDKASHYLKNPSRGIFACVFSSACTQRSS